eukprot:jgi/Psemu1/36922/gm1.36922_g
MSKKRSVKEVTNCRRTKKAPSKNQESTYVRRKTRQRSNQLPENEESSVQEVTRKIRGRRYRLPEKKPGAGECPKNDPKLRQRSNKKDLRKKLPIAGEQAESRRMSEKGSIKEPVDDFQTVAMMQSIKEMKDEEKKKTITNIIEYISAKKYIPRTNGAECIFEIIDTCCHYLRLTHQYQLPTEIWMKITLNKDFYNLAEEDKRWIDFKQHWNTSLRRLFQVVLPEELEDVTENRKESS